jgi:hypothetical protein
VVVVLVPVLRDGPTPRRLGRLSAEFAVSVRTLRRWIRWWRETFAASRFWLASAGLFARPVSGRALPSSLLLVFEGLGEAPFRVVAMLRFLTPITTGKGLFGPAF